MQSYLKLWQLGRVVIRAGTAYMWPYIRSSKEACHYGRDLLEADGESPTISAEDTVSLPLTPPPDINGAQSTVALRMIENPTGNAKHTSIDSERLQTSSVVNTPPKNIENTKITQLPPTPNASGSNITNLEESRSLPEPCPSPLQIRNSGKDSEANYSPTPTWACSTQDLTTQGTNSETSIRSSSFGDHMTSILNKTENGQTLGSASKQEHFESGSGRYTESIKIPEPPNRDQQRRARQEEKLHSLHSRNLRTRGLVNERRSQLRQSRSKISAADEDFMKLVRERRTQDCHGDSALEACFKKLQATRDEYGPLEETYDALEERLDREEYEVTQLEEQLLTRGLSNRESDLDSDKCSSDSDDSENLVVIGEPHHPLYEQYLSRLGDADLCHETHSDLLIERENLLDAQQLRQRVGKELQPQDQMRLANFPVEEAKILEELRHIEEDVERLRLECLQAGLLGEDEGEERYKEVEGDEIDILKISHGAVNSGEADYNKYQLLLQQPGKAGDEKEIQSLISQFRQGDPGDRITRWLLHKLRLSFSEVELLSRFSEELGRTADIEKWQEEVLEFWFVDSANLPPSAYEVEPTLTAFPLSLLTDCDKVSPTRFGDAQLIQLVIRSSALSWRLEFGLWLKLAGRKRKSARSV